MSMAISSSTASSVPATSSQADQAKLNQMVAQYRNLVKGGSQQAITALQRQITSLSKEIGKNVVLPSSSSSSAAPSSAPASSATPVSAAGSGKKLSVTA